jgi:transcriptional regulator with XRE-family HTH domain
MSLYHFKSGSATESNADEGLGKQIRVLRERCGLSIRKLAEGAEMTPAVISSVERGKVSPSITTLRKILEALGTDMATFFSNSEDIHEGPVFPRERMRYIGDADQSYTIIFPKQSEINIEMIDEQWYTAQKPPDFDTLTCDVAGYVISGGVFLEVRGRERLEIRPGDGFYVPKGMEHRGYVAGDGPARVITVYFPATY